MTRIEKSEYTARLEFGSSGRRKRIVDNFTVVFHTMVPLEDLHSVIQDYDIQPEADAPEILLYSHKRKKLVLSVHVVEGKGYVSGIIANR
ncbi:MAG TPA: hypothetical protein VGO43_11555 [Pyrinomonadaceae bacterium]|nr:hypothetical protein [Pyrinomonadaceae bacterium]